MLHISAFNTFRVLRTLYSIRLTLCSKAEGEIEGYCLLTKLGPASDQRQAASNGRCSQDCKEGSNAQAIVTGIFIDDGAILTIQNKRSSS